MSIIGLLFIAGFIGYLVAIDAKKRDMNYIGWGLFTFLLMIVGLPLYFVFRKPVVRHYGGSQNNRHEINVDELNDIMKSGRW